MNGLIQIYVKSAALKSGLPGLPEAIRPLIQYHWTGNRLTPYRGSKMKPCHVCSISESDRLTTARN